MNGKMLPSLNGWRAVSILLVLGAHSTMVTGFPEHHLQFWRTLFDGILGVRFFFTISGFLITWLMLREEAEFNLVSIKNFYVRRTLRIWPVYLAYVIVLVSLQFSGIAIQHAYAWRGVLTFTRNLYNKESTAPPMLWNPPSGRPLSQTNVGTTSTPMEDGRWQPGPYEDDLSGHFWSLSIEEQFYLFWPLILRFINMRGRIWFLVSAILFSIGFKTVYFLRLHGRHHLDLVLFQNFSTFIYLDCLAWGCLGAILLFTCGAGVKKFFEKNGLVLFSIAVPMIAAPWVAGLGEGIQNAGFAVLLLHSVVCPDWIFYRFLNFKWMNRIGILSYSIYIWQQFSWVMWPTVLSPVWFLWLPLAFGLAWLSYEFLEKPFFTLRTKFRNPAATLFPATRKSTS